MRRTGRSQSSALTAGRSWPLSSSPQNLDLKTASRLRDIYIKENIQTTNDLVRACNPENGRLLRPWCKAYVNWFSQKTSEHFDADNLGSILELLNLKKSRFVSLDVSFEKAELILEICDKVSGGKHLDPLIIEALDHALNSEPTEFFIRHADRIHDISNTLLSFLDSKMKKIDKRTFRTQTTIVFALHSVLILLSRSGNRELLSNPPTSKQNPQSEIVYEKLIAVLTKMKETKEYYPFVVYSELIENCLKTADEWEDSVRLLRICRYVFYESRGMSFNRNFLTTRSYAHDAFVNPAFGVSDDHDKHTSTVKEEAVQRQFTLKDDFVYNELPDLWILEKASENLSSCELQDLSASKESFKYFSLSYMSFYI